MIMIKTIIYNQYLCLSNVQRHTILLFGLLLAFSQFISAQEVIPNPPLIDITCDQRIVIVLDHGWTFFPQQALIKDGLIGFVNNLDDTGATLTIVTMGSCGNGTITSPTITYDGSNNGTHVGFINGLTFFGKNDSWSSGLSAAVNIPSDLVIIISDGDFHHGNGERQATLEAANMIKEQGAHIFLFGDRFGAYDSDNDGTLGCPEGGEDGTTDFYSALNNAVDENPSIAPFNFSANGIGSNDYIDYLGQNQIYILSNWLRILNLNSIEITSISPVECNINNLEISGTYEICDSRIPKEVELRFCKVDGHFDGEWTGRSVTTDNIDFNNGTWIWQGSSQELADLGLNMNECYDVKPILLTSVPPNVLGSEFIYGDNNDFCLDQSKPTVDIEILDEICEGEAIGITDNSSNYTEYRINICRTGNDGNCDEIEPNFVSSGWMDLPIESLDLSEAYREWSGINDYQMSCETEEGLPAQYYITVAFRNDCGTTWAQQNYVTISCLPKVDYVITDVNGNSKIEYCVGETIFLDGTESEMEEEWRVYIWQYEIGGFAQGDPGVSGGYCNPSPDGWTEGEVPLFSLNEEWAKCEGNTQDFEPGYEYRVQLVVRNRCDRWEAKEDEVFVVIDCSKECLTVNENSNLLWYFQEDASNTIGFLAYQSCSPCEVYGVNWDFGDGETSSQSSSCPSAWGSIEYHDYKYCGTYDVCLEIIYGCPEYCPVTMCQEVIVEEECAIMELEEPVKVRGRKSIIEKPLNLTNTPNPFSHETSISYYLDNDQNVSLSIYDIQGNLVEHLVNQDFQEEGYHSVNYKTDALVNGTYICIFKSAEYSKTLKMLKLK